MDITFVLGLKILFGIVTLFVLGYSAVILLILLRYSLTKATAIFITVALGFAMFSVFSHALTILPRL